MQAITKMSSLVMNVPENVKMINNKKPWKLTTDNK